MVLNARAGCMTPNLPMRSVAFTRFEIQLLEFDPRPQEDPGEHPTNLRRRGYNHLAFRVDDIGAVTSHLVANGVNMLNDEMDYISRRLRFFEGPEGITLELVQWVDSDSSQV